MRARSAGLGLSLQLALVYALLFSCGAIVFFVLAYFLAAAALEQQELDAVRDRAREYRAWYLKGGLRALEERFNEQAANTPDILFLRVSGPRGEVRFRSRGPLPDRSPADESRQGIPPPPKAGKGGWARDDAGRWTVVPVALPDGGALEVGKSSRYLERTLARFRRIFAMTVIPALVIGIGLSTMVAFRGFQPIRKLIATMRDILATGDFARRAPAAAAGNELGELGELFNRLLDRNQRLIATLRDSLDAVAHDLRTPMTRLRNVAEQALASPSADGSDATREALETCLEESEQTLTLLRSLTEIAEAEAGALRLEIEPVVIAEVVAEVLELYEFVAEERSVRLVDRAAPATLAVRTDRTRVRQVLANLVDNAVKYSPEGGTVTVSVDVVPGPPDPGDPGGPGGEVRISVADQGPGIVPSERERIFERLFRADASRSQTPGLGLGLSLVRAVATALGGRVTVDSAPGDGATFALVLPVGGPGGGGHEEPQWAAGT